MWVQLYEIDRDTVRALVRTFLDAFPDAHAFRPGRAARDLLLLGGRDAPPLDVARLEALGAMGADVVLDYTVTDYTSGKERYDLIIDIPRQPPH